MTSPPKPRPLQPVPGADRHQQAIRVAGALAELGVQSLELRSGTALTPLSCRETNLPGLLQGAPVGDELRDPRTTLRFIIGQNGLKWACDDPSMASEIARALSPARQDQK
jgi:hypothetical protein